MFMDDPEKNYEIKIYKNDGTLLKKIQKDLIPARIPQNEIEFAAKDVPHEDSRFLSPNIIHPITI